MIAFRLDGIWLETGAGLVRDWSETSPNGAREWRQPDPRRGISVRIRAGPRAACSPMKTSSFDRVRSIRATNHRPASQDMWRASRSER
jgi:hypothetical protein